MYAFSPAVIDLDEGLSIGNLPASLKFYFDERTANVTQEFRKALQQSTLDQNSNISDLENRTLSILENRTTAVENSLYLGESSSLHSDW